MTNSELADRLEHFIKQEVQKLGWTLSLCVLDKQEVVQTYKRINSWIDDAVMALRKVP